MNAALKPQPDWERYWRRRCEGAERRIQRQQRKLSEQTYLRSVAEKAEANAAEVKRLALIVSMWKEALVEIASGHPDPVARAKAMLWLWGSD